MKNSLYLFIFAIVSFSIVGCKQNQSKIQSFKEADPPVWTLTDDEIELGTPDFDTFDIAADYTPLAERLYTDTACHEYVENTPFDDVVTIAYDGQQASVTGDNGSFKVETDGAHVTLNAAKKVKVELTGNTADGSLKVIGDKKVCIVLNGLNLKNPHGPAISCLSKKECFLVTDSASTVSDDSLYTRPARALASASAGSTEADGAKASDDEQQKGCIFAEGKLCISGTAPLKIQAYGADAIHSDKSVFVRRGSQLDIQAYGGDGIQGQNNVRIEGGMLNILSASRGCSGIVAKKIVEICGGRTIVLSKTPGGNGKKNSRGIKSDSIINISRCIVRVKEESCGGKGIRSGHELNIKGAIVDVLTFGNDDKVTGSKNKGIKAKYALNIDSSRVRVRAEHGWNEAIEGRHLLTISHSLVEARAVDDAISVSEDDGDLIINGGRVYANGGMDAIDSNGTIHINGGLVFAYTSGAGSRGFDCDRKEFFIAPDATVIGIGSQLSPPTERLLKHPTAFVAVPNSTEQFVVTPSGSSECLFGINRPHFRYSDLDWSVLMSVPEFGNGGPVDVCSKASMTSPTHTFHGLQIGGKVTDKQVAHTLELDQPFTQINGAHPYVAKSRGARSSASSTPNRPADAAKQSAAGATKERSKSSATKERSSSSSTKERTSSSSSKERTSSSSTKERSSSSGSKERTSSSSTKEHSSSSSSKERTSSSGTHHHSSESGSSSSSSSTKSEGSTSSSSSSKVSIKSESSSGAHHQSSSSSSSSSSKVSIKSESSSGKTSSSSNTSAGE